MKHLTHLNAVLWSAVLVGAGLWLAHPTGGFTADPASALSPEAQALLPQLAVKDVYARRKAFLELESLREPATAPIIRQYLTSRDGDTRAFSVRALAAVEGVRALPELLDRLMKDRDPDVRLATLLAVEPLEDPAVIPALIGRLRDRNANVRIAAVDAVSHTEHPWAQEALLQRIKRERNRDVQRVLDEAAQRLGWRDARP